MQHYDGTEWHAYDKEAICCTGETIFGFSEDNIWMGGGIFMPSNGDGFDNNASIWHYDGQTWEQKYVYEIEEAHGCMGIDQIWWDAPDNIYACGYIAYDIQDDSPNNFVKGFVLHYDGVSWHELIRADFFNSDFLRVAKEKDNLYLMCAEVNPEATDALEFYLYKNGSLQLLYRVTRDVPESINMSVIDGRVYFTMKGGVYLRNDSAFVKKMTIDYGKSYSKVFGKNEKDIFLLMADGIVHYNGNNKKYIYRLPTSDMSFAGEPLMIGNDFYYCLRYPGFNEMVLHWSLVEE